MTSVSTLPITKSLSVELLLDRAGQSVCLMRLRLTSITAWRSSHRQVSNRATTPTRSRKDPQVSVVGGRVEAAGQYIHPPDHSGSGYHGTVAVILTVRMLITVLGS